MTVRGPVSAQFAAWKRAAFEPVAAAARADRARRLPEEARREPGVVPNAGACGACGGPVHCHGVCHSCLHAIEHHHADLDDAIDVECDGGCKLPRTRVWSGDPRGPARRV